MSDPTLTLTLTGSDAQRLSRLMDAGRYETPEAAVGDALEALENGQDPALEAWLHGEIARRFDAYKGDPSRGVTLEEARRRLSGRA